MDLKIKIITCNACDNCKVTVQDNSTYLPEDSTGVVKGKFKFSDTVSLDILQLNKLSKDNKIESIYMNPVYTNHSKISSSTLPVSSDGWFSLIHVVLPSKEWFYKELEKKDGSALGLYNIVYFIDSNTLYKYVNEKIEEVTITEVLEINTINTTISKTSEDFISICFLKKCYINLCSQILNNRGFSSCWSKNKIDNELIFKRDLVWMAINIIKYLTECEQLIEVERLIQVINGCNGLCSSSSSSQTDNGCGCSK